MVGGPESQDPKAEEQKDNESASSSPPEVEAEIVDAEFTEAPRAETAPPEADATPARSAILKPVVIAPLALVVLLAAAFIIWRALPPKKAAPEAPATVSEPAPAIEPQPETQMAPVTEPAATSAPAEAQEPSSPVQEVPAEKLPAPDPSKILNLAPANLKAAADAIEGMQNGETTRDLPSPPPPGGANDALQRAAKDALRAFGPETAPGETLQPEEPPAESAPEEEETSPEAAAPAEDGFARLQEEAANSAAAEEEALANLAVSRADTPPADAAKIGNDVAALEELFNTKTDRLSSELSAAQEQSAELGREVASLKESLNAAMNARSEREGQDLEDLKAELAKIRSDREQASAAKAAAASMALLALQQKLATGAPYKDELQRLSGFAPRVGGLEALSAHAETGVPTLGALKTRFGPAIRETLAADRAARSTGPISAFFARLEGLLSIRPAQPQEGASTAAVISRAEAALAADDLARTVRELGALQGAALETIGPWLGDAMARAGADAALASLSGSLAGEYGG